MLAVAVLVIALQVVMRYVVGQPLGWTEQMARYLFIWMVMLGIPIMFHRKIFMAFDLLLQALPKIVQLVMNYVIKLSICFFAAYWLWYSLQLIAATWGKLTSGIKMPLAVIYSAQPTCAFFLLLVILTQIAEDIAAAKHRAKGGGAAC
jgi:TRAP-type C4-dicarboxylate transport system permease small subunit